jgi:hypothetical protein
VEFLRRFRLPTASVHTKLMVALAVLVAVVTAGSATFLVERERAQRFRELEGRATRIADLLEQSLAQELWNVDSKAIQRQLQALAPNPEVVELTVTAIGMARWQLQARETFPTRRAPWFASGPSHMDTWRGCPRRRSARSGSSSAVPKPKRRLPERGGPSSRWRQRSC